MNTYLLNIYVCLINAKTIGLEQGLATHSSVLAWRITQTEEPGHLLAIVNSAAICEQIFA